MTRNLLTDYLNGNWYKGEDFEPSLREPSLHVEVQIVSWGDQEFEQNGEFITKPTLRFDNGKGLVLNVTNIKTLVSSFGPNPDNLIGKTITLYGKMVPFGDRDVPAVRIKPIVPADRIAARPSAERIITSGGGRLRAARFASDIPPPPPPTDYDGPDDDPEAA
jgi:hypothetical protein